MAAGPGVERAAGGGPVPLRRGINITAWFRFPASRDPAVLAGYLSDQALSDLGHAGFDFVRLAIDPAIADSHRAVLLAAIRRIQRHRLSVIVSPHAHDWHLESDPAPLRAFWHVMAPMLRSLDQSRTVPEILNEPVFHAHPEDWFTLQHDLLLEIRRSLPDATVILTGPDWGSIAGLVALPPEHDPNVLYSFHFYDPSELTSLAAYQPSLDHAAFARLPFPVDDRCPGVGSPDPRTAELMRYYCSLGWNGQRVNDAIGRAAAWADAHGVHLIAGEFGATVSLNTEARLAWLRTVRQASESRQIPWALWGYDDVMGFAVPRPPAAHPVLDPGVLGALGLPPPSRTEVSGP